MKRVRIDATSTEVELEGSRSGFESFFQAEHGRLVRALYLVAGNAHEADELSQEAFLKVWERWDRVRAMDDPTGYLYRTAMNAFRSRVRRALTAARRAVTMGEQHDDFARIDEREARARPLGRLS